MVYILVWVFLWTVISIFATWRDGTYVFHTVWHVSIYRGFKTCQRVSRGSLYAVVALRLLFPVLSMTITNDLGPVGWPVSVRFVWYSTSLYNERLESTWIIVYYLVKTSDPIIPSVWFVYYWHQTSIIWTPIATAWSYGHLVVQRMSFSVFF